MSRAQGKNSLAVGLTGNFCATDQTAWKTYLSERLKLRGYVINSRHSKYGETRVNSGVDDFHQKVIGILSERYDAKLMDNSYRGDYVEAMISEILGGDWELTWRMPKHSSWSAWDLENRVTGKKIEIKQAASWQLWVTNKPSVPRFDIKEREEVYLGDSGGEVGQYEKFNDARRVVDLYIFAWHGLTSRDKANHCDPSQWEFYVVPVEKLPKGQKTIGLQSLKQIVAAVDYKNLTATVEKILSES